MRRAARHRLRLAILALPLIPLLCLLGVGARSGATEVLITNGLNFPLVVYYDRLAGPAAPAGRTDTRSLYLNPGETKAFTIPNFATASCQYEMPRERFYAFDEQGNLIYDRTFSIRELEEIYNLVVINEATVMGPGVG